MKGKIIIQWIFAVFVLLFALVAFTTKGGIISGLLFVLLAFLISPLRTVLINALPVSLRKKGVVIASGVVLALASIFSYPSTGANDVKNSDEISKEIPEQDADTEEKKGEDAGTSQETIAGNDENIKALKFSSQGEITVEEGNTTSSGYIKADVKDESVFSEDNVIFISDSPEIATVSYDKTALTTYLYFKVEGIAPGETEIYATNADGTIESEHRKVVVKVNEKLAKEKEAAEKAEAEKKAAEEKAAKEAEEKAAKEAEEKAAKEAEEKAAKEAEASTSTKTSTEVAVIQETSKETSSSGGGAGNGDAFDTYDIPEQQNTEASYVLNTHTMKFHYPSCNSVKKIKPENYATSSASRDELISQGYDPCGNCDP